MKKIKLRYLWKEEWYYIDLCKDNAAIKFKEYENRNKTTRFNLFIGILDKNKIELFDMDIVKDGLSNNCLVKYDPNKLSYIFDKKGWLYNHYIDEMGEIEIIGNIYENPELIG